SRLQFLVEQIALSGSDVDEDLLTVVEVFIQLRNEAAVPRLGQFARVVHGHLTRFSEAILDITAETRGSETAGSFLERLHLLAEQLHVLDVAQQLTIAERVLDDAFDRR